MSIAEEKKKDKYLLKDTVPCIWRTVNLIEEPKNQDYKTTRRNAYEWSTPCKQSIECCQSTNQLYSLHLSKMLGSL